MVVVSENEAHPAVLEHLQWLKKLLNGEEPDHSQLVLLQLNVETFHRAEDSRGRIVDSLVEQVVMHSIVIGEVFVDRNSHREVQVLLLSDRSVLVSVLDHLEVISVVPKGPRGNSMMDRVWRSCRTIGGRIDRPDRHRRRLLDRRWVDRDQGGM